MHPSSRRVLKRRVSGRILDDCSLKIENILRDWVSRVRRAGMIGGRGETMRD